MDPLWYRDAVIYELHVRSFFDGNNDGYGDFVGLRSRLPYLHELGVDTLWLLPFFESPLKDDGYDIADYTRILPVHGTTEEFASFLEGAHALGMRVIIELVLNHTSDRHSWFQEARRPGSPKRDWYVWSDTTERYADARIIFRDFESSNWTWDPVAGAYFWHRFYSHQPDLNWDNPEVERALHEVMFFWLDLGVDGLRLDAVPYLYQREGTSCENLPETIAAVKRLRRAIDERYGGGKLLLAEANQWPEDTIPYFGDGEGDGVQMAFNFPLMPRLYMALRREDRRPITEMLQLTGRIPETAQWALFLRNHDELTLEMVTEEERDYLYREYAADPHFRLNLGIRRRLSPLLGGDRRRFELLNALLLTLPGTPVLYYGDEIGMGDNHFLGDRNGVRTPMQWSADRNAGFSRAPFDRLFLPPISEGPYSYAFVNVESAQADPYSRLQFVRRLLGIRNRHARLFGRGSMEVLPVENRSILAFLRRYEGETVLVVANLSRYLQHFTLPLGVLAGCTPVEPFSQAAFPLIGEDHYPMVLGPHGFALFLVQAEAAPPILADAPVDSGSVAELRLEGGLESVLVDTLLQGSAREVLEELLPRHLRAQPWLPLAPERVRIEDAIRVRAHPELYLCRLAAEPGPETIYLPLELREEDGPGALARVSSPAGDAVLRDASGHPELYALLLSLHETGWQGRSLDARFRARAEGPVPTGEDLRVLRPGLAAGRGYWIRLALRGDGSLDRAAEHIPRLVEAGMPGATPLLGSLEMRRGGDLETLVLVGTLPSRSEPLTAMDVLLREVLTTFERLQGHEPEPENGLLQESAKEVLEFARRLGARMARLHLALPRTEVGETRLLERLAALADRLIALDSATLDLPAADLERAIERVTALRSIRYDWTGATLHGAGLDGFLAAAGELYLSAFGPAGCGVALEDLAALGADLDRACHFAPGADEHGGWRPTLFVSLWSALLDAYRTAAGDARFLPPAQVWPELLFALSLERAFDDAARRGEDEGRAVLRRRLGTRKRR